MSSIAKSALWVTFSEIIFNLSGFIIHSILGRVLGPADYGRYGLVITLTTMVIVLIGNGIPTAMAKYISEIFETDPRLVLRIKKQAIILQTLIVGTITVVFYASAGLIAAALGDPTLAPLFRFSTLIIPAFAAASFYFSYYTGLHRFNTQATLKTIRSVFRIAFVVGLAFIFGLKGSISGYVIAPFSVFAIAYLIDKFKVSPALEKQKQISTAGKTDFNWRKLVNYGWQVVVFFLAYELLISIDLYMVQAILRDDALTGIYNASLTVGRIPYYIFYAMTVFLLPMVSKASVNGNFKNAKNIIDNALRIMLILLVPMIVLMSAYSQEILQLLYGRKYLAGAEPMAILVYGVGCLTIFYVLSFAMNGAGKTKTAMWISFAGLALNIATNYWLIRKLGILGSAYATTATSFAIMLLMLYWTKKYFDAGLGLGETSKVALTGAFAYLLTIILPSGRYFFIATAAIIFAVYLFTLYLMKGLTEKDINHFMSLVKKRKKEDIEQELSGNEPGA
ncbi:MAG: flippase [Candidatus Moranbacteria bacterium]|nr:flippase [Candidatus Moranbacteria bacterium]